MSTTTLYFNSASDALRFGRELKLATQAKNIIASRTKVSFPTSQTRVARSLYLRLSTRVAFLIAALLLAAGAPAQDGPWIVVDGMEEGAAVTVMARQAAPDEETRRRFPMELTVEWRYGMEHHGMPSSELLQEMYALEDALELELERKGLAMLGLARTGNGLRRWTYYAAAHPGLVGAARTAVRGRKSPATVSIRSDPAWKALHQVHSRARALRQP